MPPVGSRSEKDTQEFLGHGLILKNLTYKWLVNLTKGTLAQDAAEAVGQVRPCHGKRTGHGRTQTTLSGFNHSENDSQGAKLG